MRALAGLLLAAAAGAVLAGALAGTSETPRLAFRHRVIDADPPSGRGCCLDVCAVGDLDGDRRADVVVGSEKAEGLVWYRAPGWRRQGIGAGEFTTDGEIADVDRDGDGDVVVSCISRDRVEWWENPGSVTGEWRCHPVGPGFCHDLAVADLTGDGRADVVAFRKQAPRALTLFRAPSDPRRPWTAHRIATPEGEGLDVGDLDGDGDRDVTAGREWYRNDGNEGATWTRRPLCPTWGTECRTVIADVNGDGRLDVILSHSEGAGRLSWFVNPAWTEHPVEREPLVGAHSLEAGDLDGDGDLDLFTGEMHTSPGRRVLVYENAGGGRSWRRQLLGERGTHNARLGDVDGDGDLDLVGKNYDGPKSVELWENVSPRAARRGSAVPGPASGGARPGLAAAYPGDRGIGRDPRVLLGEDFETGSIAELGRRWSNVSNEGGRVLVFAGDAPAGSHGRRSLQVTATLGKDTGGHLYTRLPRGVERAFARFYVKFAADADYVHHFVHMGGYRPATVWPQGGAGERPRGDERVTVGIEPFGDYGRYPPPGLWSFYAYWHEMKISADGRYWGNGLRPARPARVPRGRWQCVEMMLRLNSAPDKADGELALWLDGARVAHFAKGARRGPWSGMGFALTEQGGEPFEGFRWRTSRDLPINFFWLLHYVTENAVRQNRVARPNPVCRVWFDQIVVATEYVGPIQAQKRS